MDPLNLREYEPLARAALPPGCYGFIAGGAEDEVTLRPVFGERRPARRAEAT